MIIPHSIDKVELRYGVWNPQTFTVEDEHKKGNLFKILKHLNGSLTVAEIAAQSNATIQSVEMVIDHLLPMGVLENTATSCMDQYLNLISPLFQNNQITQAITNERPVLIIGDEYLIKRITESLVRNMFPADIQSYSIQDQQFDNLHKSNNEWLDNPLLFEEILNYYKKWQQYLIIIATTYPDPIFCAQFNQIAFALKIPWMHCSLDGPFTIIGPTFLPATGPCYHCFETRIMMNLRNHACYQKYKGDLLSAQLLTPQYNFVNKPMSDLLVAHICLEICNLYYTSHCFTHGKILTIYLPTMEILFHEVLRLDCCHVCGIEKTRDEKSLYFDLTSLMEVSA